MIQQTLGDRFAPPGFFPGRLLRTLIPLAILWSSNASAAEVMAGVYVHDRDVDVSPVQSIGGFEGGGQIVLGYASERLSWLSGIGRPQAYGLAAVNTRGGTNFINAGLQWRLPIARRFYAEPAFGLAIHDGYVGRFQRRPDELNLGSRLLFSPSFAMGWQISRRVAVEGSYIHLSHAQLFGAQNPGLDELGLRLIYRLER